MTKTELEEAIKNGESVWYLFGEAYELKTSEHTNKFITRSDDYCYTDKSGVDRCAPLDMLYKSKEEAEHYLNHQDITRTETLPFLTWEEFKSGEEVIFKGRNGKGYALVYNKGLDKIDLFDTDGIMWGIIESWELTEANFYKAYDECVRLFKRE